MKKVVLKINLHVCLIITFFIRNLLFIYLFNFKVGQFQQQFGQDKICVDGTSEMMAYGFILNILVVINEFGNGVLVAYFLCNWKNKFFFT